MDSADIIKSLIVAACPKLAPDCVDGTAGSARYRQTATSFVTANFPEALTAFVYGSTAKKTTKELSDLDLYVICPGGLWTKVLEIYHGIPLEATVLSLTEIETELFGADPKAFVRASSFCVALEHSVLVYGSPDLFAKLKQRAMAWLANCPTELPVSLIYLHRIRTTNRIFDLGSAKLCSYRRIKAVFEIVDSVRILSSAERDAFQGRNLLDDLTAYWPERGQAIRDAIDAVFVRNDTVPLVQLALEALEPFGGLLLDGLRTNEWLTPDGVVR